MEENQNNTIVNENKEVVQQQNAQETPAVELENPEQINWRKFREAREIERKQKTEAEKLAAQKAAEAEALKAAMDALLNKKSHNSAEMSHDLYEEESEDDRIQKKVESALIERERKLEEERRKREQVELPSKLVSTFQDFNQVCTAYNLDYLEFHYPELAAPFRHMPDGFDKWAAVYKTVKRFVPNTDSKKEQKKAENNFNKPQSMAVPGMTQTGDSAPIQLDDKRRSENWARMQRVMKGGK
jgi:hypothetical protein